MDLGLVVRRLSRGGMLDVVSTQELADDVDRVARRQGRDHPAYRHRKPVRPVNPQWIGGMSGTPADLLRELGVATTFHVPAPFAEVAKYWAYARYCATLGLHKGFLALTNGTHDVVYHHKVAQSEQLGVALAIYVAKEILRRRYRGWEFRAVDADWALSAGVIDGVGTVKRDGNVKRRPDYFMVGSRVSEGEVRGAKVFVLECKGTHGSSPREINGPLATASVQVETVRIGNRTPPALMVSSRLQPDRIIVHVLDPDGDEDLWSGTEAEMDEMLSGDPGEAEIRSHPLYTDEGAATPEPSPRQPSATADGDEGDPSGEAGDADEDETEPLPGTLRVLDIPEQRRAWFFQILSRNAAASALSFAGDDVAASEYATARQRDPGTWAGRPPDPGQFEIDGIRSQGNLELPERPIEEFQLGDVTYLGTRYAIPLPNGGELQMRRGLELRSYELLQNPRSLGRYIRTAGRALGLWRNWRENHGQDPDHAISIGQDGTALSMRIVD